MSERSLTTDSDDTYVRGRSTEVRNIPAKFHGSVLPAQARDGLAFWLLVVVLVAATENARPETPLLLARLLDFARIVVILSGIPDLGPAVTIGLGVSPAIADSLLDGSGWRGAAHPPRDAAENREILVRIAALGGLRAANEILRVHARHRLGRIRRPLA